MYWSGPRPAESVVVGEPELKSVLLRATSTDARVMGLRLSGYAVGFVASIPIARALCRLAGDSTPARWPCSGSWWHSGTSGWRSADSTWPVGGGICITCGRMPPCSRGRRHCVLGQCGRDIRGRPSRRRRPAAVLDRYPDGLVPLLLMSLHWADLLQFDGRLLGLRERPGRAWLLPARSDACRATGPRARTPPRYASELQPYVVAWTAPSRPPARPLAPAERR